jgi:anti-sigma factor RsiW
MHQSISKNLEEYLNGSASEIPAEFHRHLGECPDCAGDLERLEAQSQLLRSLGSAKDAALRPGFYARVMERIEAQKRLSIWSVFLDRKFGFRLAVASGMLAALLCGYLVTSEPGGSETGVAATVSTVGSAGASAGSGLDASLDQDDALQRDAVLVDLASYRQ